MTAQLMLESAIRASVLGMGAWGLLRLLKIRSPAHEWMTWLGVLIAALGMPVATPLAAQLLPDATEAVTLRSWPRGLWAVLWPAYLGVTGALLARLGVGLFMVRRVWRVATPVPSLSAGAVRVRSSHHVEAPVATGAGILLPADWSRWSVEQREWVLAHERSHVARNDFHWHVLTQVYLALFWMSPVAWWLRHRITLLAEYMSDDAALEALGRPAEYAALLLEFSAGRRRGSLAVGVARRSDVPRRIERIVNTARHTGTRRRSSAALAIGGLAIAALSTTVPWFRVAASPASRSQPAHIEWRTGSQQPLHPSASSARQTPRLTRLQSRGLLSTDQLSPLKSRLRPLEPLNR